MKRDKRKTEVRSMSSILRATDELIALIESRRGSVADQMVAKTAALAEESLRKSNALMEQFAKQNRLAFMITTGYTPEEFEKQSKNASVQTAVKERVQNLQQGIEDPDIKEAAAKAREEAENELRKRRQKDEVFSPGAFEDALRAILFRIPEEEPSRIELASIGAYLMVTSCNIRRISRLTGRSREYINRRHERLKQLLSSARETLD